MTMTTRDGAAGTIVIELGPEGAATEAELAERFRAAKAILLTTRTPVDVVDAALAPLYRAARVTLQRRQG